MKLLIIDTSYPEIFSLGIYVEPSLYSVVKGPPNDFSSLWKELENLFRVSGIGRREIEAVSVAVGPGPFTSLRSGVSIGKTVSQILGIKIVAFSSVEVIEESFSEIKPVILFDGGAGKLLVKRHNSDSLEIVKPQEFKVVESDVIVSVGCAKIVQQMGIKSINLDYLPPQMILKLVVSKIAKGEFRHFSEVLPIYHKQYGNLT
ncbi:MAG: hypothetical protein ABDH28_06875 [Brevinematia bacterium]